MSDSASSNAMRVIRVYRRLPPLRGGMELHIARLSKAQRELGVDVVNVHNVGCAEGPAIQVWRGRNLDRVWPQSLRNFLFYLGALRKVSELRGSPPTVLHVHGAWSDFLFSKALAGAIKADATFASIHGVARPRWRWLHRLALSHCSVILATGKSEQKFLTEALGRDVIHLPSGLAEEFARPSSESLPLACFDVVSVGNLVPKKRMDLVLECARRRPNLQFAIVGDGPLRRMLDDTVSRDALKNVSILGRRDPEEVAASLRASRVFFSTSEEEGAPTAALEAMAVGLPVILAPSNDFSWLVEQGVNGFVTKDWSVSELLEKIDLILSDEACRSEIGARNRANVKDHVWPKIAARLTKLMAARVGAGFSQ